MAAALNAAFPAEQIIYFGDTEHLPYGEKSHDSIIEYANGIGDFLLSKGCKLIIIACNSASAHAFESLRERVGKRATVLNVLDPMVDGVSRMPDCKRIGLIGTKATVQSGRYQSELGSKLPQAEVFALATPLLAPMVEEGYAGDSISARIIANYLSREEMPDELDAMILACTHYPLLKKEIEDYYSGRVKVLDSTDFIVEQVRKVLEEQDSAAEERTEEHEFYVSEYTESFREIAGHFFPGETRLNHYPLWH